MRGRRAQLELLRAAGATGHRYSNLSPDTGSSRTHRGACRARRDGRSDEPTAGRAGPDDGPDSTFSPGAVVCWTLGNLHQTKVTIHYVLYKKN